MRIATWNVNSVTARVPRLVQWLGSADPDVVCLQETKCAEDDFPYDAVGAVGYDVAVHGLGRWNGVAVLSRVGLCEVVKGLEGEPGFPEPEARAIAATCAGVRVWSVYVPHGREPDHPHYAYKLEWLRALCGVVAGELSDDRPLAVCGDFNVAPTDADVWDPAEFVHATHVTPAERQALAALQALGLADADFEGSIPSGNYGAGVMLVWDRGTYEAFEWGDDKVTFRLAGGRYRGEYHMVKTARGWLVFLAKGSAVPSPEAPPEFSPMLAEGGHGPFDDPGWRFEPMLDGVRTLAYVSPAGTRLVSPTGGDQTAQYPELGRLAHHVKAASAVLDGEIIACSRAGRPCSEFLQRRVHLTSRGAIERVRRDMPVKLFVFDLLWLDGVDLTGMPLEDRRRRLERIVSEGDPIGLTFVLDGECHRLLEAARGLGIDGVVGKRLGSRYLPGRRSTDWRTIKAMAAPLLAVDGPSLLYRAFFALPKTITGPDGQAVNALLGAANLLLAAVEAHRPRAVVVCFGAEAARYRVELYPPYHADRPPMPAELESQWADAPGFFGAFGWDVIAHDTLEADDLLGSLAALETEAGGRALLFTGDRDMFQCVGARVAVLFPTGAGKAGPEVVDVDGVRRRYGIEPEQVPDFIALRGDPSDGLPGARGIGEKTARYLLRAHGSLEGAIAWAGGDRGRVAAALAKDADQLRAFREIARLRRADLGRPPDRPTDFAGAAAAARARGMNRLAERLQANTSTPTVQGPRGAPNQVEISPPTRDVAPTPTPDTQAMPAGIVPMLASSGALPGADERWAYEFKWDGVRAVAYSQPGHWRLESRNLNDITGRYPELAGLHAALGSHRVVLDGEIVCFDANGQPSFAALQHRMHIAAEAKARQLAQTSPVTYLIFDVLWLDGYSLMGQPYGQRRQHLAALGLDGEHWRIPDHVVGGGAALLAASAAQQREGIVAKRLDSRYEPGRRSSTWVKIKNIGRQEFVIGGWMPGQGHRTARIGALLLGVHDEAGGLRYAGRVGTGFSEPELDRLDRLMASLQRADSPFSPAGPPPPRGAVFCAAEFVCEVEFTEWTRDGQLRHPSYKGLRDDKPTGLVVREDTPAAPVVVEDTPGGLVVRGETANSARTQVQGRELVLSNLTKVLYPRGGFTKRAVIDYYAAIAPVLLPHLQGRALTLKRYPDGVDGKAFYEKQAPAHRPDWVQTVALASQRRQWIDYTLAPDLATLVWLANLAALELHTPLARAATAQRPSTLVFDLDPGQPATIIECCWVGLLLKGMFEGLGLKSWAKTSGSKGLQVYVPLNSDVTFAQTKPFVRQVAELFQRTEPDLVVSRQTKSLRPGKVLIDWSQNDQHKTTVCVYSLRARERPTVSTPVDWDEVRAALDSGDPDDLAYDTAQVLDRVSTRGDLFAPVLSVVQALPS